MTNDKPVREPDVFERLQANAMEATSLDDLAVILRDAGEAILALSTYALIAIRNSLYAKRMQEIKFPGDFDLYGQLGEDAMNVYFRDRGDVAEKILASEGTAEQLHTCLGALHSLRGAQWSIRAAAEILRPGVEYDAPRNLTASSQSAS